MDSPTLPKWVSPFCALIGFSISAACGANLSTPAVISLVLLCGKITGWVLNMSPRFPLATRIENGK